MRTIKEVIMRIFTPELASQIKTSDKIRFVTRNLKDEQTVSILKTDYTCEWRQLLQYNRHIFLGIIKFWDRTTDGHLSRIYRQSVEEMELKGLIIQLKNNDNLLIKTFDDMQYYKKYNGIELLDRIEFYFNSQEIYDDADFDLSKVFEQDRLEMIKLHEYADLRIG